MQQQMDLYVAVPTPREWDLARARVAMALSECDVNENSVHELHARVTKSGIKRAVGFKFRAERPIIERLVVSLDLLFREGELDIVGQLVPPKQDEELQAADARAHKQLKGIKKKNQDSRLVAPPTELRMKKDAADGSAEKN